MANAAPLHASIDGAVVARDVDAGHEDDEIADPDIDDLSNDAFVMDDLAGNRKRLTNNRAADVTEKGSGIAGLGGVLTAVGG